MSYFDDTIGERLGLNQLDVPKCVKCGNQMKASWKKEICGKCLEEVKEIG